MKPGDLVTPVAGTFGLFESWGNKSRGDRNIGLFRTGEIGILLDDTLHMGGNGARVLTAGGRVGWCYRSEITVMGEP